jgi:hypothetical protein
MTDAEITLYKIFDDALRGRIHSIEDEVIRLNIEKDAIQKNLNEYRKQFKCDHLNPDGSSALVSEFLWYSCSICGEDL